MNEIIKLVFDILSFSCIMVLVVGGLAIIASLMGIFNFAHGEFVLLGAYTVFVFRETGLPVWSGMIAAPLVVGAFGLFLEVTIIRRFYKEGIAAMLATYAIAVIIRETVRGLIGGRFLKIEEPIPGQFQMGDMNFSIWRAVIIILTILIMLACYLFLTRTNYGLKIRGAMENPSLARACGISTTQLYSYTFVFGSALAGLAGALIVPLYALFAELGLRFLVMAFLSVMLGGIGTFEGPVLGSAMIGAMVPGYQWLREIPFIVDILSPVFAEILVFVTAIILVAFRPQGLFHKSRL
jgi:branched-chain amino acid transport system permease protein|tara:strand:+ start:2921 stop:3805 length:885 start_codon:yes stop_codon:yes gene_type:complete